MLMQTADRENFQTRYVLRIPGPVSERLPRSRGVLPRSRPARGARGADARQPDRLADRDIRSELPKR
jgi:hypothetical protein